MNVPRTDPTVVAVDALAFGVAVRAQVAVGTRDRLVANDPIGVVIGVAHPPWRQELTPWK
jgi:hypothetical protein